MTPELVTAFGQFGALGILVLFLMWRDVRSAEKRGQIEKERTEADKALAAALSALTVMIQQLYQSVNK